MGSNSNFFSRKIDNMKKNIELFKQLDKKSQQKTITEALINNALTIVIILLVIVTTIDNANFFSIASIINIATLSSTRLVMALGIACCIVTSSTDLSAGRSLGLASCVSASLLQSPDYISKMYPSVTWLETTAYPILPLLGTLVVAMMVCGAIGFFNGFCVAKFSIHPYIVTLASQLVVYGMALIYTGWGTHNGTSTPIGALDPRYTEFVIGQWFLIPNVVWIAAATAGIMWFVWNKTSFGKKLFAVGGNREAASVSGVSVFWIMVISFTIAGVMFGFSGFLESARVGSNTAATGQGYEGDAIAACVIGGVSFTGGVGKISGVVTGVVLIQLINAALVFLRVPGAYTYIVRGSLILVSVAIDMRKYLVKR